ncbi:UNVERIFIED_CONTAM: hypothetical protein Sradi_2038000 [Sesamum radiatum]|uniref:Uncharacterized protein n=1 Tax=Sesamum radiatum TaxID=300843 RepID=A0AAW2TI74_SESRA
MAPSNASSLKQPPLQLNGPISPANTTPRTLSSIHLNPLLPESFSLLMPPPPLIHCHNSHSWFISTVVDSASAQPLGSATMFFLGNLSATAKNHCLFSRLPPRSRKQAPNSLRGLLLRP